MSDVISTTGHWPDFALDGGTSGKLWPAHAIRDSYDVVWERKARSGYSPVEYIYQRSFECVLHVDVNSASTATSAMTGFLAQMFCANPVVRLPGGDGVAVPVTLSGTWLIVRISTQDHGNGCSRVSVTLESPRASWYDAAGVEVTDE